MTRLGHTHGSSCPIFRPTSSLAPDRTVRLASCNQTHTTRCHDPAALRHSVQRSYLCIFNSCQNQFLHVSKIRCNVQAGHNFPAKIHLNSCLSLHYVCSYSCFNLISFLFPVFPFVFPKFPLASRFRCPHYVHSFVLYPSTTDSHSASLQITILDMLYQTMVCALCIWYWFRFPLAEPLIL